MRPFRRRRHRRLWNRITSPHRAPLSSLLSPPFWMLRRRISPAPGTMGAPCAAILERPVLRHSHPTSTQGEITSRESHRYQFVHRVGAKAKCLLTTRSPAQLFLCEQHSGNPGLFDRNKGIMEHPVSENNQSGLWRESLEISPNCSCRRCNVTVLLRWNK
ncbi:unnamed protein product [Pleuronectes platessa]|uniref:Uncharacterized protein n=1 Tax=Pleuronectes platessa TaxID=8262 RepID=A0A9N7V3V4_PLEPL|nr:unnamed protein product [Pleuronectes platessa]